MFVRPTVFRAMLFAVVVSLGALASPLTAQDSTGCDCVIRHGARQPSEFERRSSGVFTILQSRPSGALSNNIGMGYGGQATYLFRLDRAGVFALRLDAGFLQYGSESKRVPLSETIGGRIQVDVSTQNNIVPVTIGAQMMAPRGILRPYVNAGIGGQFFFTESHVDGADDDHDFASTTNQSDGTGAWTAGAGVYIPVYERRTKVAIDVGAQFVNGGQAQYLKPGSIQDLPGGQIRISPMRSETHMVLIRVGVKVGL